MKPLVSSALNSNKVELQRKRDISSPQPHARAHGRLLGKDHLERGLRRIIAPGWERKVG